MTREEMRLEDLRAAWAARSGAADDCPSDGALWAAARGEAGAGEARRMALHLAGCAACTDGWRLARDLGAAPLPARRARDSRAAAPWWALSAAAAAAMVALLYFEAADRMRPPSVPAVRAPGEEAVRSTLAPGEPLDRRDCVLRWSGPEGARYDIQVTRADLTPLAGARGLETTEYRVPPEVLAALPRGMRLFWQVRGTLADGAPLPPATFVATLD